MNVSARSHRFDATFESTIVTAIRGVLDLQIVDATVGSEIQSAIKYNEKIIIIAIQWRKFAYGNS